MAKLCTSKIPHNQDSLWSSLVCFSAMMCWTAAIGFVFSFGIFFPVFMDYFKEDRERTAWIGSLAIALVFFTGSVSGIMVSKFGCRVTSLVGAIICAVSLASASMSQSVVVLYLSYSIPFGIGTSFIFNAGLVIVSNYFTRRRSLALGFVSAGQGLGVLVQGPLLQTLIDHYGWKSTYRIMAGVIFGVCLLGVTYDPNVKSDMEVENADQLPSSDEKRSHQPREKRRCMFLDVSVWKIPAFVAITLSSGIAQFGHFVPQIHLIRFCEDIGITADKASKLYIYYGISSATARVISGRICDTRVINPMYIYQGVEFVVGLSTILITLADSYSDMIVFAAFYGFCDGCFITTLNVILLTSVEEAKRPASLGWNMQVASIFMGSGPPIAGLMADRMGSYHGAFYLAGSTVILGAAIPFILFFVKTPIAHHEDKGQIVKHDTQGRDFPFRDNLAYVAELDANHGTEAHTDSPCGDVKKEMIGLPLAGAIDTVLPCTEEGGSSDSTKSAENNNNPPLLLENGGSSDSINPAENNNNSPLLVDTVTGTSETEARDDELISIDTKTQDTLQPIAYQVEVQINSTLASTNSVDNKQETPEQLVHDTKF